MKVAQLFKGGGGGGVFLRPPLNGSRGHYM